MSWSVSPCRNGTEVKRSRRGAAPTDVKVLSHSTQVAEQPIIEVELLVEMNWGAHRFIVCIKSRCMWKMWDLQTLFAFTLSSADRRMQETLHQTLFPRQQIDECMTRCIKCQCTTRIISREFSNVRLHRLQVSVLPLGQINECHLTHASCSVQALPWFEICAWGR